MTEPTTSKELPPRFWEDKTLQQMSPAQWEALCDGCGKCCLNKLEDYDTGEVALTRVACRLLDNASCRCIHYENRHAHVPACITMTPSNIEKNAYWLPRSCAYRLLWEGAPLPSWHPLITGDANSVHRAGISVQGQTISEDDVDETDWEKHIIEELG